MLSQGSLGLSSESDVEIKLNPSLTEFSDGSPVLRWEVWFVTLSGLVKERPENDPFIPIPVACGSHSFAAYLGDTVNTVCT